MKNEQWLYMAATAAAIFFFLYWTERNRRISLGGQLSAAIGDSNPEYVQKPAGSKLDAVLTANPVGKPAGA